MSTSTAKLGCLFGKPDIERCDLFIDSGFLDWGPYDQGGKYRPNKRGILSRGHQTKCGIAKISGYFEDEFKSVYVGDRYIETSRLLGRSFTKPTAGEWKPTGPAKKHATPGDIHGTFTKPKQATAFSPLTKPDLRKKEHLKNMLTKPGKKGNCGYVDIGINEYPEHTYKGRVDEYDYAQELYSKNWVKHKKKIKGPLKSMTYPQPFFEPNPYTDPEESEPGPTYEPPYERWYRTPRVFYPSRYPKKPGNNHDGCFDKWPEWEEEPYMTVLEAKKALAKINPKYKGRIIKPAPQIKTYYTRSIVNNKIDYCCNERTWRTMKPITYPQFN